MEPNEYVVHIQIALPRHYYDQLMEAKGKGISWTNWMIDRLEYKKEKDGKKDGTESNR